MVKHCLIQVMFEFGEHRLNLEELWHFFEFGFANLVLILKNINRNSENWMYLPILGISVYVFHIDFW